MSEPVYFQHFEVERGEDGSLRELGRGAMGITYKAFDTNLHVPVALKIINAQLTGDGKARERFLREARAAARLRHPNVATVLHLGQEAETCFYAMEFIAGETLESFVGRRGPLAAGLALEIAAQAARALGAAQSEGLVHRDIKPANLMLARHQGEEEDDDQDQEEPPRNVHVKVIDFGLAKFIEKSKFDVGSTTLSLTMAGAFVGSPYYASPEQIEEGDVDIRSDIYSLGVTLWYLLTGKPPFTGSLGQIMAQHLQRTPPIEEMARRGVPPPVCNLLSRMLAKNREDRHPDPAALRREIAECQRALTGAASPAAASAAASSSGAGSSGAEASASPSVGHGAPPPVSAGPVVAGRFELGEDFGEWEIGRLYKAADRRAPGRLAAVWKLYPDLLADAAHAAEVGQAITMIQCASVPGLLFVHALDRSPDGDYLVTEWFEGFDLSEVLNARKQLKAPEVFTLLQKLASTVDDAAETGLEKLNLNLRSIKVGFPEGMPRGAAGQALLNEPLKSWPPFEVKIDLLELRPAARKTSAGNERTLLPQRSDPTQARRPIEGKAGMVWSLAEVVYELLGGTLPPAGVPRYPPLTELSEKANAVMRRALVTGTGPGFTGARQFALALFAAASSSAEPPPYQRQPPPPQPRPSLPTGVLGAGVSDESKTQSPPSPPPAMSGETGGAVSPPRRRRRRWWLFGLIALGIFCIVQVAKRGDREDKEDQVAAAIQQAKRAQEDALKKLDKGLPVEVRRAMPVEEATPPPSDPPPQSPPPQPPAYAPSPPPVQNAPPFALNNPPPVSRPHLTYPSPPLAIYRARLSERDHYSSTGVRLTTIPDILRQDRANYHRFDKRDPEDESDPFFADANNRSFFDSLRFNGPREVFLDGTPLVEVAIMRGNRVIATVLER